MLANINRHVLLELMDGLAARLRPGGHLIVSGLYTTDRAEMTEAAEAHGLRLVSEATEDEWWAGGLGRPVPPDDER